MEPTPIAPVRPKPPLVLRDAFPENLLAKSYEIPPRTSGESLAPPRLRLAVNEPSSAMTAAPDRPMRVVAVSFRSGEGVPEAAETAAVTDVFAAARHGYSGGLMLLFAGFGNVWQRDTEAIAELAAQHGAHVLFESGKSGDPNTRFMGLEPSQRHQISGDGQWFANSAQLRGDPSLVDAFLAAAKPGGSRRFTLANHHIGLLICGENNILVNKQSEGNRCDGVRFHPEAPLFTDTHIIHNGAHTLMGNWSKLDARFRWLSTGRRLVTYATNQPQTGGWRRAVRMYYDGQRIGDGESVLPHGPLGATLLVDPRDGYRGVAVDLPPP